MSRRLPLPAALALAAVGGGILVFAYPGYNLWFLAPVSIALLAVATRGRRGRTGALIGFVHGLTFLIPLLSWTGIQVGALPWLALATMEAGFHALGGIGLALTSRLRPGWAPVLSGAGVWVGVEALQGRQPFGGFGWSRLAYSQADAPTLGLAALAGPALISFAVAAIGLLLVELIGNQRSLTQRLAFAAVAALVLLSGLVVPRPVNAEAGSWQVAGIQGSVPKMGMEFNAKRRAVLDKHAELTHELATQVRNGDQPKPDLVIWPENSSDIDPFLNRDAYQVIESAVDDLGSPALLGTLVVNQQTEMIRNTVLYWQPGIGPVARYAKRAPVPFAEYVPYRDFFRKITPLVDRAGSTEAGESVGVLPVETSAGTGRVGILICFEVVPDRLVTDVIDEGAQLLVVPTNNATFGFTDESRQQLAISRVRAVQTGRAVAHVSTVGVSGLTNPDGTVVEAAPLFDATILNAKLPLRNSLTIADQLKTGPEALLVLIGILGAGSGWRVRRQQGRQAGHEDEATLAGVGAAGADRAAGGGDHFAGRPRPEDRVVADRAGVGGDHGHRGAADST